MGDEQTSLLNRARRSTGHARRANAGCCFGVAAVAGVVTIAASERPGLRLRQLATPFQWASIGSYHPDGYLVVTIPEAVRRRLQDLVDEHPDGDISFGGQNEEAEDAIIFGPTSRILLREPLLGELREAMRPLVSAFCGCALADEAYVGSNGIRVYRRGASLAHHLDWAHKFVVSATLNVRQKNSSARWPLALRAFGGPLVELSHAEGDAVLYEGSRMLHARSEPLADDFYAAAFVGFVPRRYPEGAGALTRAYVRAARYFE